jgi:hypothetical protein
MYLYGKALRIGKRLKVGDIRVCLQNSIGQLISSTLLNAMAILKLGYAIFN